MQSLNVTTTLPPSSMPRIVSSTPSPVQTSTPEFNNPDDISAQDVLTVQQIPILAGVSGAFFVLMGTAAVVLKYRRTAKSPSPSLDRTHTLSLNRNKTVMRNNVHEEEVAPSRTLYSMSV